MRHFPLTKTQMGIYVECITHRDTPIYHIALLTRFNVKTNLDDLKRAVEKAVKAHSVAKLRIAADSKGEPYQYMSEDESVDIVIEKMSDGELELKKEKWPEVMPLENAPLLHFRLIETQSAKWLYQVHHHIVSDGKSFQILANDILLALNGGEIETEQVSVTDLFTREEALRLSPSFESARQWFAKEFGGLDTQTPPLFDVDSHRALPQESKVYSKTLNINHRELFEASRKYHVKLSVLTDGAFGYMAGMFVGAKDALFSTVYNSRQAKENNTIAMMATTIPVYCKWKQETSVEEYLCALQTQREGVKQHAAYSFADACADLQLPHDLMFTYRGSTVIGNIHIGEDTQKISDFSTEDGLNWVLDHENGRLVLSVAYRIDQYSHELIESMTSAYESVLCQMVTVDKLSEITLVNAREQVEYDGRWHQEMDYDESLSMVDLWNAQVGRTPDNIAVVAGKQLFSYKQIDKQSDKVATYLHSIGIGKGDVVAVIIPRNEFMAIASLGVLKTGAAYLPLDPSYPEERLNFMVQDSNAAYLIADIELCGKIEGFENKTLLTQDIEGLMGSKIDCKPNPQDPFILLYTSGTTGTPKGCRLLHSNLVDYVNVIQPIYHYDSDSKVTAYASYGFDANMFDLYPGLTHGATIHIIEEDIRFDMVALNEYFATQGITHAFMTTQVARTFASSVEVPDSLKYLSCGGESFIPIAKPESYSMYNLYGPTETTVFVTAQVFDKEYDRIPIGAALPNTRLYVVDANGHILPPFAVGELWIAGRQVGDGYLNRPDINAKSFIVNPFSEDRHYDRVYRTGDVVRRLGDGRIDYIGRRDGQVKVRGFRIELSEVVAVIREYPEISDATVVACDDLAGGKFLAAYIVSDTKIDIKALNAFIAERKPIYMVPAVTMQIEKIPLNQNHKVDKKALPKPEFQAENSPKTDRSLNTLEKSLQEIVGSVLKVENADVTTPLELLGLSSISSIKLAWAIYKRFGLDIKSKDLLGYNSIESVENKLLDYWMNDSGPTDTAASNGENSNLPLTISQQGVYADCMRNLETTTYNIPLLYSFPRTQHVEQLSTCVKEVFALHPYLHTYFTIYEFDVVHTLSKNREVGIEHQTMSEEQFADFKRSFIRPFNLHKAPLYRIAIVQTEVHVYLLIDIHHIIFDGSSLSVFTSELQSLLNGGTPTSETTTYQDYIQKELAIDKEANKPYFDTLLKDCESASEITPDIPQKDDNQGEGEEVSEYLDFERIEQFCKEEHITPASLCLAATGYAVSRFTGTHSAYLNTVSTGRNDVHFADTIGMFVKTLPVVVNVSDCTNAQFVRETAAMLRSTVEHEVYPYMQICHDFNYAPHIMYEYQLGLEECMVVDGNNIERESLESDTLKFKIAIRVELRDGRPAIIVYYKNGLYSKPLMSRLARAIVIAAHQIVSSPEQRIRTVSIVSEADRRLLKQFSTACPACQVENKIFHEMLESQVDKAPDKEILVAADGRFTYRQLEQRANSVANCLLSMNLKKGDKVVVLLHRTSRFFSAVFGISKAGGVFIPSNPDYPIDRIKTIMEDSTARFIITENELVQLYDKALDITTIEAFEDSSRPCASVLASDLVYMIYTSGSTGKPKGVELRHESICNYLTPHELNPQVNLVLSQGSCYGSVTTVAFDMSFKEWAIALCNGMKLVFASDKEALDPMALASTLEENGVDVFNATPSRLLQYMEVESFTKVIAKCKVILCGGEKYPIKLLHLLHNTTQATILNTYGPTEITVSSNAANLTHTDTVSVGRPLLNYEEYIVDADDNILPIGVVGELVICGVGVASGYHNLPEQTAKAFMNFHGKRAYRSGDYSRWLEDGSVEILGRKDNQVKIRGLRIELGEIEKVLTSVPSVKSGLVLIKKIGNQEVLCAYYTLEKGVRLDVAAIKTAMAEHLTDYMVPSAFVQLESLPLTPNGKINTKVLPEPQAIERSTVKVAHSKNEKLFARIFSDVLELDNVYADDNFFELGGTSLTVTRVVIAAHKAGVDITYAEVFDNPTPAKLAALSCANDTDSEVFLCPEFENLADYDYSAIDKLLKNNTLDSFINGARQEFSHVLLTGATGFLGIHILYELLHNRPDCKVTCLLRRRDSMSAKARVSALFFYYFEESLEELFGDRVSIVEGNVTNKESFEECKNRHIDLVINCAANVKHFSEGTDIEDVNYYGTLNVMEFCKSVEARLVHVSTMSVAGAFVDKEPAVTYLEENLLFYGQQQVSKYTQSKFLAERAVLQAVADGSLSAKIMRVGNLAPRNNDGEYQINFSTNSFMARIKSTYLVGAHSYESQVTTFELSPIDAVAKAILLLADTPKENVIFHPYNNHQLLMGDLYQIMSSLGYNSTAMEEADYQTALEKAAEDPRKAALLTGLLAYRQGHGVKMYNTAKSGKLTIAVLSRLDFHWPMTDTEYVRRFIIALSTLGFFDDTISMRP